VPKVCEFHQVNSFSRKLFIALAHFVGVTGRGVLPPPPGSVQPRRRAEGDASLALLWQIVVFGRFIRIPESIFQ
jgi:hypothetical protein